MAHKLDHIDDFDRIVLMEEGEIIECDAPENLLSIPSSFRRMYESRHQSDVM